MKCVICNKAVDMFNVDLGEDIKVHLTCFFNESIPNPPSKTDVNFEKLNSEREAAIQKRVEEIKSTTNDQ